MAVRPQPNTLRLLLLRLPLQARQRLAAAGGKLVHAFQERDGRVSYRPYREASAAMMALLKSGGAAGAAADGGGGGGSAAGSSSGCWGVPGVRLLVVERASIDEAFVLLATHAAAAQVRAG